MATSSALIAVSVLAAVGAVSPASAAAAACHHKAGSNQWEVCVNGEAIGSATQKQSVEFVTTGRSGVKSVFSGLSPLFASGTASIACVVHGKGKLESGIGGVAAVGVHYTWEGCEYVQTPYKERCLVNGGPEGFYVSAEMVGTWVKTGTKFSLAASSGGQFATFSTENGIPGKPCPATMVAELWLLKGSFAETFVEAETEKAAHTLVGTAESTIQINETGKNKLAAEQTIELTGANKGRSFSIIEGN